MLFLQFISAEALMYKTDKTQWLFLTGRSCLCRWMEVYMGKCLFLLSFISSHFVIFISDGGGCSAQLRSGTGEAEIAFCCVALPLCNLLTL